MKNTKADAINWLDDQKEVFQDIAKKIWRNPEVGLKEKYASDLQISALEEEGFRIERSIGEMETAFIAEYGQGGPTLGVLGEYDALPGLSQKVKAKREPLQDGEPGHGCGHNLLGTAGVAGAIAIKQALEAGEIAGTIRYYGCPAEETLVGKVYMAKEGVFDDLDACLTWHPGDVNSTWVSSSLAMNSVRFTFSGVPAHAAASPEQGRSALDALELMNVGTEYMREHISDKSRIHYSIPEGGEEPNIVPPKAVSWYYVRAPKRKEVDRIYEWLGQVAEGAALMARVDVERELLTACYNYLANRTLADVVLENMQKIGGPEFGSEEKKLAAQLEDTFDPGQKENLADRGIPEEVREQVLHTEVVDEPYDVGQVGFGSTDVGDVSWIVPLAQFRAATQPVGTAGHTWQETAAAGSGIGLEGMHFAAKVFAASLIDLYTTPDLIDEAKAEFEDSTGGKQYVSPLPEDARPNSTKV